MKNRNRTYWVILRPGEDVDCYVAHALDNDFIVSHRSPRDALALLIEMMQDQELDDRADGFRFEERRPAPPEYWAQRDALLGQHSLAPLTDAALRPLGRMRRTAVVVLEVPAPTTKVQSSQALIKKLLSQARIAA